MKKQNKKLRTFRIYFNEGSPSLDISNYLTMEEFSINLFKGKIYVSKSEGGIIPSLAINTDNINYVMEVKND